MLRPEAEHSLGATYGADRAGTRAASPELGAGDITAAFLAIPHNLPELHDRQVTRGAWIASMYPLQ